jgi:hypothetical protein
LIHNALTRKQCRNNDRAIAREVGRKIVAVEQWFQSQSICVGFVVEFGRFHSNTSIASRQYYSAVAHIGGGA